MASNFVSLLYKKKTFTNAEYNSLRSFTDVVQLVPYAHGVFGKSTLLIQLMNRHLESLIYLIMDARILHKFAPSKVDPFGNTALIVACELKLSLIALELIKNTKANIDHPSTSSGNTALMLACDNMLSDVAIKLIKTGHSNPIQVNYTGETALMMACFNNMPEVALELIQTGHSNPGHANKRRETALMMACYYKMPEVALSIIKTGQSNPDYTNNDGNTALIISCYSKILEVSLAIIKTGKSNSFHPNKHRETALMVACLKKTPEVALELIKTNQSNPGQSNVHGDTALIYACFNKMSEVAIELIKTGKSNPNHRNDHNMTALDTAISRNLHSVVNLLQHKYKMVIEHNNPPLSVTSTAYDMIEGDVKIASYLLSNISNIAIYANDRWFLSNKNNIQQLIDSGDGVVYKCNDASGYLSQSNVDLSNKYFRLRSIGIFLDFVPLNYMYAILGSNHQYFSLELTKIILPSVVSYNVYEHGASWMSRAHCQEGQGGHVYNMRQTNKNKFNTPNKTSKTKKTKQHHSI